MDNRNFKYIIFFNSAALIRNLLGVIRAKFTSIWLGVSGVGVLGQIITLYNLQTRLVDFGVFPLLINRIGKIDRKKDYEEYVQIIFYTFLILMFTNTLFFLVFLLSRNVLSILLFKSANYSYLIVLLAFLNPVFSLASLPETLVRANKNFPRLSMGQNLTSLVGLLTIIPVIWFWGIKGIVYNFFIFLAFNAAFFLPFTREYLRGLSFRNLRINYQLLSQVLKFCLTDTSRKIMIFFSFFIFRIIIVQFAGMKDNGYFQSIWSISGYLNVLFTAFIVYLFPTLSSIREAGQFQKEMNLNLAYLLYMIFPFAAVIMLIPELCLKLLFNQAFAMMSYSLVVFVYFKIFEAIYVFFTIAFLSQARLRAYIVSEFVRSMTLIGVSYYLVKHFQLNGAVWSIILMNLTSLMAVSFFITKEKMFQLSDENTRLIFRLFITAGILLIPHDSNNYVRVVQVLAFLTLSVITLDLKKYYKLLAIFLKRQ